MGFTSAKDCRRARGDKEKLSLKQDVCFVFCPDLGQITVRGSTKRSWRRLRELRKGKDAGIHPYQPRQTAEHRKINWP